MDDTSDLGHAAKILLSDPRGELIETGGETASHWIDIWKTKRANAERSGTVTHGFDEAFDRLSHIAPDQLITLAVHISATGMVLSWINERQQLLCAAVLRKD